MEDFWGLGFECNKWSHLFDINSYSGLGLGLGLGLDLRLGLGYDK